MSRPADPRGLTPRQARFVEEYAVDCNATQAAIRAGYSHRTARSIGEENLRKPAIAAAIAAACEDRAERVGLQADDVLRELAVVVHSDVRDFTCDDATGELTLRDGAPDDAWRAVASLKRKVRFIPQKDGAQVIERELEFKLWDKNAAIDKAMRHLGQYRDPEGDDNRKPTNLTITFNVVAEGPRFGEIGGKISNGDGR